MKKLKNKPRTVIQKRKNLKKRIQINRKAIDISDNLGIFKSDGLCSGIPNENIGKLEKRSAGRKSFSLINQVN